jgi:hypothetical protein
MSILFSLTQFNFIQTKVRIFNIKYFDMSQYFGSPIVPISFFVACLISNVLNMRQKKIELFKFNEIFAGTLIHIRTRMVM